MKPCHDTVAIKVLAKANCIIIIELSLNFNGVFGRKLVVLRTIFFMFGKFLVHVWSWCGDFSGKQSISVC